MSTTGVNTTKTVPQNIHFVFSRLTKVSKLATNSPETTM